MPARKKIGLQTVAFSRPVAVVGAACSVGPLEGEGPLLLGFGTYRGSSISRAQPSGGALKSSRAFP